MPRWYITDTEYPAVRRVMGSQRDRMSDEALEEVLERTFPGSGPGEVEDFMQSLQQFGKQAGPIVQKVAPGMAQGAMAGSALGPWGAVIGGLAGGASSLLSSGGPAAGSAPPRAAPSAPAAVVPSMAAMGGIGTPTPARYMPQLAAPAGAQGAASAQLLTLLSRPETMQALLALLMGSSGRSSIPIGERQVPVTAFANAIAELASEAAIDPGGPARYWYEPSGAPRCDLADPRARTALLWRDVAEAAEAETNDAEEAPMWESDDGDAIESFEAALIGESSDDD
jgi:hypothetical protein